LLKVPKTKGSRAAGRELLAQEILGSGDPKTLINRDLKIKNTVNMHLRFVMGG
jgi:hypothetical protein